MDLIAHLPGYQWWQGYAPELYRLSDERSAIAAKKQIAVVATAGVTPLFYQKQPDKLPAVKALRRDNLARLKQAKIKVRIGSERFDATVLDEIDYLRSMGLYSDVQLFSMFVSDTPRLLFPTRQIGAFAEGG